MPQLRLFRPPSDVNLERGRFQAADLAWAFPIDVETRTSRLDSVISGVGSDSITQFALNTPPGTAGGLI